MKLKIDTEYANTDLDLESEHPFETLNQELEKMCDIIHYTRCDDGYWRSVVEAQQLDFDEASKRQAEVDIIGMIEAIKKLSSKARDEFDACCLREFNIGFWCGDTQGYVHSLPHSVVQAVAELNCSIAVTLYPMRHPDGSVRE